MSVQALTIELDGRELAFEPGETILDVARRNGTAIPTLCHDPRLEPAGACRTCLVEVEGARRMLPACATRATAGMRVTTESGRIARHRRTLLGLYLADQPAEPERRERGRANEVIEMAREVAAPEDWGHLEPVRTTRTGDENPYVDFDASTCILCARCTRYCDEVEAVQAIGLTGRGSATTISTADGRGLLDTSCELCGGCIAVCPTGAMAEKLPLTRGERHERELEVTRSTCNFCGVGCQVDLHVDPAARPGGKLVKVTSPEPGTTTNDGNLCVKGRFAYDFVHHGDRLTTPLLRGADGELHPASWEEALDAAARGLVGVRDRHGANALAFVSSSRCTVEENYLVQKLSRAVFRTNNVHQCAAT